MYFRLIAVLLALALASQLPTPAAAQEAHAPAIVDLTVVDYAIRMPEELPSGWTTLRFVNEGSEPHHVLFARMPEGRTFENYVTEVQPPFQEIWYQLRDEGLAQDRAMELLVQNLPAWMWEVEFMGGPGIAAPGIVSEVTVYLTPGEYAVECYMKTDEGELHWAEGMVRPLRVTEERSPATPPEEDVRVTITNEAMVIHEEVRPGPQVVGVHVQESPEVGFGHNVYVARMNDEATIEDLLYYLNFMNVDGLKPDAPATFVGGTHILPTGHSAYVTVDFEPGRYAFVSEYTGHMGIWQEVTVGH